MGRYDDAYFEAVQAHDDAKGDYYQLVEKLQQLGNILDKPESIAFVNEAVEQLPPGRKNVLASAFLTFNEIKAAHRRWIETLNTKNRIGDQVQEDATKDERRRARRNEDNG